MESISLTADTAFAIRGKSELSVSKIDSLF